MNKINKIFIQLNEVLKAMINKGYIHRDLKLGNILINYIDNNKNNFNIKLTDFKLSNINYLSPEIENNHYYNKSGFRSLGVISYELYINKYIFDSKNIEERENNIIKGLLIKEIDNKMNNKLTRKLINIDINKRIECEEYFSDEFLKRIIQNKFIEIKIIFSYLNDEKILNLIINNKNLKKILEVNIKNINNSVIKILQASKSFV